jgi:hypothetical protein
MLANEEFHQDDEKQWLCVEGKEEIIDSSFEFTEIQQGLTSKFYDAPTKPDKPVSSVGKRFSFIGTREKKNIRFGFQSQPKPWFPPNVFNKIDKLRQGLIDRVEMTGLLNEIATISINFYNLASEQFVALRFDGRIVEVADSEIELLLKIQGRDYGTPVFVWHVGYESFLGWNP